MNCPKCGRAGLIVIDSRDKEGNVVMRRRKCSKCHERFTTTEAIGVPPTEKRFSAVVGTAVQIKYLADRIISDLEKISTLD